MLSQANLVVAVIAEAIAFPNEEILRFNAVGIVAYRTLSNAYRPVNPITLIHGGVTARAEFALLASQLEVPVAYILMAGITTEFVVFEMVFVYPLAGRVDDRFSFPRGCEQNFRGIHAEHEDNRHYDEPISNESLIHFFTSNNP
jgi:hypothetical protein